MITATDITKLKRDDNIILDILYKKGKSHYVKSESYIMFPTRYLKVGLLDMGRQIQVFGSFAFINGDKYSVVSFPAKITITPSVIEEINYLDKPYYLMSFTDLFSNTDIYIPSADDLNKIFEDMVIKNNNIPWYIEYEDLPKLFFKAIEITGSKMALNPLGILTLVSIVGRDNENNYIRLKEKNKIKDIKWVGLSNVSVGYSNAISMITGSYLAQGMASALAGNITSPSDIEKALIS